MVELKAAGLWKCSAYTWEQLGHEHDGTLARASVDGGCFVKKGFVLNTFEDGHWSFHQGAPCSLPLGSAGDIDNLIMSSMNLGDVQRCKDRCWRNPVCGAIYFGGGKDKT